MDYDTERQLPTTKVRGLAHVKTDTQTQALVD